jgi:hypothetical protein
MGQGMFALQEINQMEQEMCSYLKWQLNVEPSMLLLKLRLNHFIAYALHRTQLHLSVMFATFYLLQCRPISLLPRVLPDTSYLYPPSCLLRR